MVGFALLKARKHILEIILLYAIPNEEKFGTMVAFGAYKIALMKRCDKIYIAPRNHELRQTFMRHGYTTLCGTEDINEVMEKPVRASKYIKTNTTRKTTQKTASNMESQTRRNVGNTVTRPYTLKKRKTHNNPIN